MKFWRVTGFVAIAAVSLFTMIWVSEQLECVRHPGSVARDLGCFAGHLGPAALLILAFVKVLGPVFESGAQTQRADRVDQRVDHALHTGPRWRIYSAGAGMGALLVLATLGAFLSQLVQAIALKSFVICFLTLLLGHWVARRRLARGSSIQLAMPPHRHLLWLVVVLTTAASGAYAVAATTGGLQASIEVLAPILIGAFTLGLLVHDLAQPLAPGSVHLVGVAGRLDRTEQDHPRNKL